MENAEFDKHYAAKMRQGSAPDLSEEDWARLSPLLVAEQKRQWRAFPLWWLGVLSALLMCSNLAWWALWEKSEQRSKSLQQEWQQYRKEAVIKQDTSWSKVVVYQYDTIYRTVVHRSLSDLQAPAKTGSPLYESPISKTSNADSLVGAQALQPVAINTSRLSPDYGQSSATSHPTSPAYEAELGFAYVAEEEPNQPRYSVVSTPLPFRTPYLKIPARPIQIPQAELVFVPLQHAKTPRQPLLIPRNYRLGAGAGMFFPAEAAFSESFGFSSGLSAEIAFSDHLALVLDGAYSSLSFKSNAYNESWGLPPISTPGDDYRFNYLETEDELKSSWQIGAGFRYWWQPNKKLSPYLGLGYSAQWHPEYELKLEFTHKVTNEEKESTLEAPAINGISYFDFNAGLRYRFLRKLYLQTGGFYQLKIDQAQPGIPGYWGIKTAVLYAF